MRISALSTAKHRESDMETVVDKINELVHKLNVQLVRINEFEVKLDELKKETKKK